MSPATRALLVTSLSVVFLFLLSSYTAYNTSSSQQHSVVARNVFEGAEIVVANATGTGCIDINKCEDRCACAKDNAHSPFRACRMTGGRINYLKWYYCSLKGLAPLSFFLMILWMLVLVYLLITTTEHYFCPSLSKLSKRLRLSNSVAGVTFLAFSNGSPDLFSAFSALSHDASSIGINSLLGGGVFVTTLVVGAVSIASPGMILSRRSFLRDILFYTVSALVFMLIVVDGEVHLWESACFIGIYIAYIAGIFITRYVRQRSKRLRREALGIIEDAGEELFEVNDVTDDAMPLLEDILFLTNLRSWSSSSKYKKSVNGEGGLLYSDDEDDDTGEFIHKPTPSKVMKNCWYRALSSIGWAELGVRDKLFLVLLWPIALLRALSVPSAGPEGQWSRPLAVISPITVSLLTIFSFKLFNYKVHMHSVDVPLFAIILVTGIIFAVVILFTTRNREPPRYYMVFVVLGFIAATMWMYLFAAEIITLVRSFGRIMNLSDSLLGLTVVAWATSVVDLVADIVVAKQGFTDMAIGACFGAPTFSLLLGLGISLTYTNTQYYPDPFKLEVTDDLWTGFIFLGVSLASSIIFMPVNNFTTNKRFGLYLIIVYIAFNVVSILNELGYGFLPKGH